MSLELYVTSQRALSVEPRRDAADRDLGTVAAARISSAFAAGSGQGLLHLATVELKTPLPETIAYARAIATRYLTQLSHLGAEIKAGAQALVDPPADDELNRLALSAPPMKGLEYLDAETLQRAWLAIDARVRTELAASGKSLREYLHDRNPVWRLVGRIALHLAENRRDEEYPFAFMATYASGVSAQGETRNLPLARALQEFAGTANRKRLAELLRPVRDAAERLSWVQELITSGDIYQALAWKPAEAYRFLQDVPALEDAGLAVRIPNWWQPTRPPRPQVTVRVGEQGRAALGADALLDFSVALSLGGETLTDAEQRELLQSTAGLLRVRGQWVEVNGERLAAALAHWHRVEASAQSGAISFYEGMRLLAGVSGAADVAAHAADAESLRSWSGIEPGAWLEDLLARIRNPTGEHDLRLDRLQATLRPYQIAGVKWLTLMTRLGLGACLADDMGLGKTIQVVALLLQLRQPAKPGSGVTGDRAGEAAGDDPAARPTLIVAPASLIANWKSELERFAPVLSVFVAHPSESDIDLDDRRAVDDAIAGRDAVITTYGLIMRSAPLRERRWRLVVVDEAQAMKNPGARQTRAVKQLAAGGRVALTGTPVENRLSDLWSLFDFLNPGLLGSAQEFARMTRRLAERGEQRYAPLRRLVQPYILRRLKTDKRVIDDLPDKTEVRAFCGLTREQAGLYERCVRQLSHQLVTQTQGIQRRGLVLSHLMQLKQICNHPAQWQGESGYSPGRSGKFERLSTLCEELAERQQRVLVFTQFREIVEPLVQHLAGVFGRPGLALHGGTPVARRRGLVAEFQREDGPPYFVLSLKAGGTGLNLTAATQVVHFDRWWNPAVENQATDRAFRIGQKRNVIVHKFVCRGTVEEKIDALIEAKTSLSRDLLDAGGEALLTEMTDQELLRTVALDIHKACDA